MMKWQIESQAMFLSANEGKCKQDSAIHSQFLAGNSPRSQLPINLTKL